MEVGSGGGNVLCYNLLSSKGTVEVIWDLSAFQKSTRKEELAVWAIPAEWDYASIFKVSKYNNRGDHQN